MDKDGCLTWSESQACHGQERCLSSLGKCAACEPNAVEDCDTGQLGACQEGQRTCKADGSGWGLCVEKVSQSNEVCDDLDNDCDGQIDEEVTRSCYSGPKDTAGNGSCKAGSQVCRGGMWEACMGEELPGVEVCDGLDNNCDGQIDEVGCGWLWPGQADLGTKTISITQSHVDGKENLYVMGGFREKLTIQNKSLSPGGDGRVSYFLAKFSRDGTLLWLKRLIDQLWGVGGVSLVGNASGDLIVYGAYKILKIDGKTYNANSVYDQFFLRLDSTGKRLWMTTEPGAGHYRVPPDIRVTMDSKGNSRVLLSVYGITLTLGSKTHRSSNGFLTIFAELDTNGVWGDSFQIASGAVIRNIRYDALDNLVFEGNFTASLTSGKLQFGATTNPRSWSVLVLSPTGKELLNQQLSAQATTNVSNPLLRIYDLIVSPSGEVAFSGFLSGKLTLGTLAPLTSTSTSTYVTLRLDAQQKWSVVYEARKLGASVRTQAFDAKGNVYYALPYSRRSAKLDICGQSLDFSQDHGIVLFRFDAAGKCTIVKVLRDKGATGYNMLSFQLLVDRLGWVTLIAQAHQSITIGSRTIQGYQPFIWKTLFP